MFINIRRGVCYMKYFVKKHPMGNHNIFNKRPVEEIIRDKALECYKFRNMGGFGALSTIQLFTRGTTYNQGDFTIWTWKFVIL